MDDGRIKVVCCNQRRRRQRFWVAGWLAGWLDVCLQCGEEDGEELEANRNYASKSRNQEKGVALFRGGGLTGSGGERESLVTIYFNKLV